MKKSLLMASLLVFGFFLVIASVMVTPVQASASAQAGLIERGKYIVSIAGCNDCHTNYGPEYLDPSKLTFEQIKTLSFDGKDALDKNKYMAGGRLFDLGPGGKVYTSNLTPDIETGIGSWTDEQIKVAIRSGQKPDGRILVPVMPYRNFNTMADSDLDAVVAYLRSIPAVKNKVSESTFSTEGFQPLPYTQGIVAPDPADKTAHGEYLLKTITGCTDCHTPLDPANGAPMMDQYLAGGQPYEGPWGIVYGGNLTPDAETGIGGWTEQEIKAAFLTGVNNKGRRLILMPWFAYRGMSTSDADTLAYYIKNKLSPVKNEVPAASLNDGFNVLSPNAAPAAPTLPLLPIFAGVVVIILVVAVLIYMAIKRKQNIP